MAQLRKDKAETLARLNESITAGKSLAEDIQTTKTNVEALFRDHTIWQHTVVELLNELFETNEAPEARTDNPTSTEIRTLDESIMADITQLSMIHSSVDRGQFPQVIPPEKSTTEKWIYRLKDIRFVAVFVIVGIVLSNVFGLINSGSQAWENVFGKSHTKKGLVSFEEMGIKASFVTKKDELVPIPDADLEKILGDRHVLDTTSGLVFLKLDFKLSDLQEKQYHGIQFHFWRDFYDRFGGDKSDVPFWTSKELKSGLNREYRCQYWDHNLNFTIKSPITP